MWGETKRGNPMADHEPPLTLTFGAILRIGIPVSILWIIGDAIDGGSQSFIGVPLLVAAWLGAFVALDRWVSAGPSSSASGSWSPSERNWSNAMNQRDHQNTRNTP
jgi:hypothetical protein